MPAETKKSRPSKSPVSTQPGSKSKAAGRKSRGPWVALTIAALLGSGTAWMHDSTKQAGAHFDERRAEVRQYFDEHLYLELDPSLEKLLEASQFDRRRLYFDDTADGGRREVPERQRRSEQSQLAGLVQQASAAEALLPAGLFGVRSASDPPRNFLVHAAAHTTGVAACLTLIVLLAAGMALENAWGHVLFALFCGVSTVGLALARVASAPVHELPWAGSSGLAAALLGAYLALTLRGVGRFYGGLLSGWLLLPMWVASQYAMVHPFWQPGFDSSLVFIHSIGAGAGFAVAGLLSALGLERQADGSALEKATPAARAMGNARRAQSSGQDGLAFTLLRTEAERSPGNAEVVAALWKLAKQLGEEDAAGPAVVALVKRAIREKRGADAAKLWLDLVLAGVRANVDPLTLVCIGEALLDEGHANEAVAAMQRAAESEETIPSALALRIVDVARDLDPYLTQVAARLALADARLPAVKRDALLVLAEGAATAVGQAPADEIAGIAGLEGLEGAAPAAAAQPVGVVSPSDEDSLEPIAELVGESPWQADGEVAEIEALDPEALSEDALSELVDASHDPIAADADQIASWNDPGIVGDLGVEVGDGDIDTDSADTLALDRLPGEIGQSGESVQELESLDAIDPEALSLSDEPAVVDTAVQFERPSRCLKVLNVIPVALEADALALDVEGKGKTSLPYHRIEAIAVAAVEGLPERSGETPGGAAPHRRVIVLDLVLDWKSYEGGEMRVLRIRCDSFDPRRIVPAASPLESLKGLLDSLLSHTDATPLPNARGARGNPFARFASLDAYEADVLGTDPGQQ